MTWIRLVLITALATTAVSYMIMLSISLQSAGIIPTAWYLALDVAAVSFWTFWISLILTWLLSQLTIRSDSEISTNIKHLSKLFHYTAVPGLFYTIMVLFFAIVESQTTAILLISPSTAQFHLIALVIWLHCIKSVATNILRTIQSRFISDAIPPSQK
jgi:hypothetical protein